jgi:hypothetical protein
VANPVVSHRVSFRLPSYPRSCKPPYDLGRRDFPVPVLQPLQLALLEAIGRDVPHPNAVRFALERAREQSGRPPALALALPEHVARRDPPMRTQSLASYDRRYAPPEDPPEQADHD